MTDILDAIDTITVQCANIPDVLDALDVIEKHIERLKSKKYAVAVMDHDDIIIEIVTNPINWKDALARHTKMRMEDEAIGDVSWLSDDMEDAKLDAISADFMFDIVEIK